MGNIYIDRFNVVELSRQEQDGIIGGGIFGGPTNWFYELGVKFGKWLAELDECSLPANYDSFYYGGACNGWSSIL